MPAARTWEDRIYDEFIRDATPADFFNVPLAEDEESDARELMGHVRYMATNREQLTRATAKLLSKDKDGNWPEDTRNVGMTTHTVQWLRIEHHGQYWEVAYGSQEATSNFSAVARGRTLAEALFNVAQEG